MNIVEYGSNLAKVVGPNGPSKVRISSKASSKVRIFGGIFGPVFFGPVFFGGLLVRSRRAGLAHWSYYAMARETF